MFRQFRFLMPAGFVLMIISLVINRPSLSALWKNVSSFPCNILFLIALAGFAAYATESLGDLPALAIYGSEDGVLSMEKLETGRQYAKDYAEICIDGGNHAGFGCYGAQSGDGTASITQEEQWAQTAETILDWIGQD